MRLPENDSLSVSPDFTPEAGPSTLTPPLPSKLHTNGNSNGFTSSAVTNGVSKHAKAPISRVTLPGTTLYEDSHIDREEFVRLIIQSLRDVGYIESAATLEAESGYVMESPEVSEFRQCILDGDWGEAEVALTRLGVSEDEGLWEAKFLINQQKYLEYLEAGRSTAALHVLRNELAPLNMEPEQLQPLSSLMMYTDPTELRQKAGWDGAHGSSRRTLLASLQRYIPSSVMIPPRRFASLLDQSQQYQRYQCLYHNVPTTSQSFSLYNDHHCDQDMFPRMTTAILEDHTDEVWNLEWSHSGRRLASASKDKTVIIWAVQTDAEPTTREYRREQVLKEHQYPVGCLAWSLDDSILLSSSDQYINMWNTQTGICIRTLDAHTETVSALAWVPDGSGFISGSQDRKIILWGSDGKQRDSWGITGIRITDLAVTPDFTRLVAVGESATGPSSQHPAPSGRGDTATPPVGGSRNNTHANSNASRSTEYLMIVYDLATKQPEVTVVLEGQLTSVKISDDSQYALINHAPDEVHLWDISTGRMARKYTGQRQGRHIIRSCFGGVDGNFVVSGSEDGNVYVWHRDRGILLDVLSGHGSGSVNSVAWNPRNKRMFASCSDDFTIRIWEPTPAAVSRQASSSRAADGMLLESEPEPSGKGKGKRREPWDDSALDGPGSRGAQI
ncbi:WD40 repeat-like protein [Dentipellis sp. KUC8613]|nr:WD40 repeat-like protein [Dentipellis sp. KUC8613]